LKAGLGEGFGDLEVGVVGSGDGDEVDAVAGGPLQLGGDHLLIGGVGPLRRDVVVRSGRLGLGRVGGEGAGDEDGAVVHNGGDGMDLANEGALAAADQAHAQFAVSAVRSLP